MSLSSVVERIRKEKQLGAEVPGFDPRNGNEQAKFLFLFEAPGAKAIKTGYVSFDNPDPTARNFQNQLAAAGIGREEIALWNTVPWYIGNEEGTAIRAANGNDIQDGIEYLAPIVEEISNLKAIILMGGAARRAHVFLSRITTARIVSCHHTSAKVMNSSPNASAENIEVLRFIKWSTGPSVANNSL
jgi:uracil-DNA glycosylase